MEQVTLYSESHELQRTDAFYVLENYFRFVKWDPEVQSNVLDIGCGDGDVTVHLLLPKLPRNVRQLIATDISDEMLLFAKTKCRSDKVSFRKLDISTKEVPTDFEENFDHVFSFYCLHWVQNQRQAMSNIYRMLKSGGDMLLAFLASSPIFSIYENMAKMKRWSKYMQNIDGCIAPFQNSKNPREEYEDIISKIGFKSRFCRVEDREFTYNNVTILQKSVLAVCPFTSLLSYEEVQLYWSDFMNEVRKHKDVKVEKRTNNNEERIHVSYQMFVVFATKP